jgi:fatty acid-binding protein DegV
VKIGVVRNRHDQLAFAQDHLGRHLDKTSRAMILVQYADNQSWVEQIAAAQIYKRFPAAEIVIRPLSLTSGAHMGPGTWAVAFLPPLNSPQTDSRDR